MRSARLECLPVLHHGLDGKGVKGTGEPFVRALVAYHHRKRHSVPGEVGIDIHHLHRLGLGLLSGGMGGMPLLPQELRRAEEKPGAHLPAHYIGPLVAQDREIPP